MANTKFVGCIAKHALKTTLPKDVSDALADGRNGLLKKYINEKLPEEKANIENAYEASQKEHTANLLQSTPAWSYTNKPNDPNNELNLFTTTGLKSILKNLVQRFGSIANVLKSDFVNDEQIDERDVKVLHFFSKSGGFGQQFSKALESIYKTKEFIQFRYEDLLQYFPERDTVDPSKVIPVSYPNTTVTTAFDTVIRNAMAATAFEWLNTDGIMATGQTESSLKRMFGLEKDEEVPSAMREHLMDIGIHRDRLADQLGRVILERLNIKATKKADFTAEDKLVRSLGYMTIATMENMKYSDGTYILSRQELYNGIPGEAFGLEALKSNISIPASEVFYDPTPEQRLKDNAADDADNTGKKGKPTQIYIRVNSNRSSSHELHSDLDESSNLLNEAPEAFDKVFGNTSEVKTVSWKRIFLPDTVKIGKFGKASKKQRANLQKNIDVPYSKSEHTMAAFLAITGAAKELMVGMQTMDNKLAIRNKSIAGSNRGIMRDLKAIDNWLKQEALQIEKGESTLFYIGAKFMNQMRMLQTGFSPQNSKIIRNLFSPQAFNIEFDPKTDKALQEAFLQSIALSFEIETIKEGGKANQLKLLKAKLKNEDIAAAIKVLKQFNKTGKAMTDEQQMLVAKGVQATGSKLHGLKGLVEYARYDSYMRSKDENKGLFKTDMYNEHDGVSNGVVIGVANLIPNLDREGYQDVLAALAMGGIGIGNRTGIPNMDTLMAKDTLNDAYQRMAQEWALIEARVKLSLFRDIQNPNIKATDKNKAEQRYDQFLALESLLGRFTEHKDINGNKINNGVINKLIRKLSKPRTMQTLYGASIATQNRILAIESVINDGIYDSIEKIAASLTDDSNHVNAIADLTKLFTTVKDLTSNHANLNVNAYLTDGKIDKSKLLGILDSDGKITQKGFELNNDQINDIVLATRMTYGDAMKQAIESVYAPVIAARKPFVTLIQRAATTYNLVLKAKVEKAIFDKNRLLEAEFQTQTEAANAQKKAMSQIAARERRNLSKEEYKIINSAFPKKIDTNQNNNKITREDLDDILTSIEHLIPRIKTPFHTESDPSYLYLAQVGVSKEADSINKKDYSSGVTVNQNYNGTTPRHKGYVTSIPYLEEVGASGMVKAIQMLDSVFANHAMGIEGVDLLSIHDGFVHGIKDSQLVADTLNRSFGEVTFGTKDTPAYSLGSAFADMHADMTKNEKEALSIILDENGVSLQTMIDQFLSDRVINFDTFDIDEASINQEIKQIQKTEKEQKLPITPYKKLKLDLFKKAIGLHDLMTPDEQKTFLDKMHQLITSKANTMAKEVTANKQAIGNMVTSLAQYPYNGKGITQESISQDTTIFGIDRNSVLNVADKLASKNIREMQSMRDQGIFASNEDGASTEISDYDGPDADTRTIDSKNVVEVLDSLANLDQQAAAASIQDSPEHLSDVRRILSDIVSTVMKPVEFYMAQYKQQNDETAGSYTPSNRSIWIQRQQVGQPSPGILGTGVRMSAAVTYAHEMIHHITHFGLRNNADLAYQTADLYDFTRTQLEAKYKDKAFVVFLNVNFADDADRDSYLADPANIYAIQAAKVRYDYLFNPKQNANQTHNGLDEFLAFGMTDERFKKELMTLNISPELLNKRKTLFTVFEKNIQQTIVNIYRMTLDFIQNMFNQQHHSSVVGQELENLVSALAKVDAKGKNVILSAAADAEARVSLFGLKMDEHIKDVANVAMNKFQLGRAITALKEFPEANNMISHQIRVAMLWYNNQELGVIPTIINEIKGATPNLAKIIDLQAKNNLMIDVAKQDASKNMAATLRSFFKKEPDSEQKIAITKVLLKGDISLLMDDYSLDEVKGWLTSKTQREAKIASLFKEVNALINSVAKSPTKRKHYMNFFQGGIQDMAYAMITGEHFKEGKTYLNANNLARMSNSIYENSLVATEIFPELVKLLDQLGSISAMNYTSIRDNRAVLNLMDTDPDAISNVLFTHKKLKEQAITDLFGDNPHQMMKGYVKTIVNSRIQIEQGLEADEAKFADRGFTKMAIPFARDTAIDPVTETIYMYVSKNGTINDYQSGAVSITRNKTKGASPYDIQQQVGNTATASDVANINNKQALDNVKAVIHQMLMSPVRTKTSKTENNLTPQFDSRGKMTTLRYIMSEQTKDTVLEQFNEFDSVMGEMAASRIDKLNTPVINAEVVIALREMWDAEKDKYPEAYVNIGPNSILKRHRDIYESFPPKMKQHILSEWGEKGMMVSQNVVDIAFGQRKYSITELFTKSDAERGLVERLIVEGLVFAMGWKNPFVQKQLESPIGRAMTRAKTLEDFFTQLTKLAKGNIIVRNVLVTYGNHISNVMYLKSKGVPLKDIILLQREAFISALQYQSDHDKLQQLIVKRDVMLLKNEDVVGINRNIMRLENAIAHNPSTPMIKAGLLPSITDDVNTEITPSPYKFGLDKGIDTVLSKLPNKVEKFGRVMFMTEDTEGYKMANNMVKMTDYVSRYVLYKHYTKKGVEHKDAVAQVQDEFINFALPTHRMLEYANNVGLIWFSKYQLRSLKHIKNLIMEHPFSALATFIIGSTMFHNNIINTIPWLMKDMSVMVNTPMSSVASSVDDIFPINMLGTITGAVI